jgi:hypothetical protein
MAIKFAEMTIQSIINHANLLRLLSNTYIYTHSFTSKEYNKVFNDLGLCKGYDCRCKNAVPSLETLKKRGFIHKIAEEHYLVYRDNTSYCGEIIDITDEQYNNLPDYFKDMVTVEERVRYTYAFDYIKVNEIIDFAAHIQSF